ncbi:hypothetical protein XA68_14754 [Ophiocordyceps unilateralis]|uniref:Uncharacterized protein n=1 Tax=Ophiocordyceps unilateralis TaxID=268505 RepID=A0A2A9P8V2_OPHUN|nr:hypothetical protein XA68_14754 [Ophiocordyceps unilateralis]
MLHAVRHRLPYTIQTYMPTRSQSRGCSMDKTEIRPDGMSNTWLFCRPRHPGRKQQQEEVEEEEEQEQEQENKTRRGEAT